MYEGIATGGGSIGCIALDDGIKGTFPANDMSGLKSTNGAGPP